ncbi:DUF3016 domain-containing protein [Pseudidiomarina sp. WS423]|uniref:DUF3016 domain-containing protein n=1 Tax=Pseudidiomarina sp. WS423 TaxID=3425124 RepID=UPI003D6E04CA
MMKKTLLVTGLMLAGLCHQTALAAEAKVSWGDPKKFFDIEAVGDKQDRFEQRVMDELTAYIGELAEKLPADHHFTIAINDLDLTGRVEPVFVDTGMRYQRVVDEISYPMIKFTYSYTDANGQVIQEGEERIKDLGSIITRREIMRSSRDNVYFEKQLLRDWFKDNFKEYF